MGFASVTKDAFLGGKLQILQPEVGYRAGADPVLLAASVPASSGESVLELGCGVGTALLCLGARVSGLDLTGVELQADYADLARKNAEANGHVAEIVCADLRAMPLSVRDRQFHHVIANPPYYVEKRRKKSGDAGKETAFTEDAPLGLWIETAAKRLRPKGVLSVVQDVERLPELLAETREHLGSIEVLPVTGRVGRGAHRVLMRARKGGRAEFKLHAPLHLHEGRDHVKDADSYLPEIRAILRDGAALNFP
ncbi:MULTISPECIES: tRNA1(Val) (adenine(37)-N6)-methyltransferase [Halocynthiibacter]|uniref:Methyltransferase n=1 Tax=Halocynthiibacter halioticoli TaxID=2986804 RepID=A0AAE3IY60_9RHOB|nr:MULTISPECIES: methyltransferase domain-containing protein [Halocynthiibacter]MCV6823280.1 methyltransferase [Halocynthiibacter halioticoli]MCW4056281.1 methyltransferase [Halocynthiibacter sp. SDUM655004]